MDLDLVLHVEVAMEPVSKHRTCKYSRGPILVCLSIDPSFHPRPGLSKKKHDRPFFLDFCKLRSIPARWTSAGDDDPLVVISAGRSMYRVADLLELAKLIREIQQ